MNNKETILLVANWDSDVGYAWWLMEAYWSHIAEVAVDYDVVLAYPSVSKLPQTIVESPILIEQLDFRPTNRTALYRQLKYLVQNNVKYIYYTDQPTLSWKYFLYRLAGVRTLIMHEHAPGLRSKPGKLVKKIKQFRWWLLFL